MTKAIEIRRTDTVRNFSRRRIIWVLGWFGIAAGLGCQQDPMPPPPTNTSMLRGIVAVYAMATRDLGRPPKSMDELEAVYAEADPETSKYVRSTRDGEEFVVVWGIRWDSLPRDTVVAYERKGLDGKRMVVTAGSVVREVTQQEFAKLKFPKDHTPAT